MLSISFHPRFFLGDDKVGVELFPDFLSQDFCLGRHALVFSDPAPDVMSGFPFEAWLLPAMKTTLMIRKEVIL